MSDGSAAPGPPQSWPRLIVPALLTVGIAAGGTYLCALPGGSGDIDSRTWEYVFTLPLRLVGLIFVGVIAGGVGGAAFVRAGSAYAGWLIAVGGCLLGSFAAVAGFAGYGDILVAGVVVFAIAAAIGTWLGDRATRSAPPAG